MGLFDRLKNSVESKAKSFASDLVSGDNNKAEDKAANNPDGLAYAKCVNIAFGKIPTTLEEFKSMDGADFMDPNKVVALSVVALCVYPKNSELAIEMINFLKGPKPLSTYELGFIKERFRGREYLADSYLDGATYKNEYKPNEPLSINVYKTSHSEDAISEGYLQLFLKSGGADNGRGVRLRKKESSGQWFLWEYFILSEIRKPESEDPWA